MFNSAAATVPQLALLLHSQRRHRADAGGAAGGEPGGEEGGDGENEGREGQGNGIDGADFVEHAGQDFPVPAVSPLESGTCGSMSLRGTV